MYPVPSISDLAAWSGRDEATYTSYANSALMQAVIRYMFVTEVSDPSQIMGYGAIAAADMVTMVTQGILALADQIYLQFPYQQVNASPLNSETIGSYTYQKSMQTGGGGSMSKLAPAAMELSMEKTGITLFDLATQWTALRTFAGGVFHEGMSVFEDGERSGRMGAALYIEDDNGRRTILGPEDHNRMAMPFDVNSQSFPMDPGI
jgi:hypothetical protein